MADESLEQAILQAAEIAKKLPEGLQEAAFNRALDHILAGSAPTSGQRKTKTSSEKTSVGDTANRVGELLHAIDRTAHPDVGTTTRTADRALKVLQLARQDYGVDGLTASEIAEILAQKFRLPVKVSAVKMALQRETSTVDVRPGPGGSRLFHIMAPGDEYLAHLREDSHASTDGGAGSRTSPKKPNAPNRRRRASSKPKIQEGPPGDSGVKARKKTNGRPGPKAAVAILADDGFFDEPRTISQIQEELRHHKGHTYSVQELSPALVRSLRDNTLTRERKDSGQYEYTRA